MGFRLARRRRPSLSALLALLAAVVAVVAVDDLAEAKRGKVIKGSNKGERIEGTNKKDRINARGGKDRIAAKRGNDRVKAGKGNDKAKGGPGRDNVKGNGGKDKLKGGGGKDKLKGNGGKDKLNGGGGNDKVAGGGGNDKLKGAKGVDKLIGGGGGDVINAIDGTADARIDGGPGNDVCKIDPEDQPKVRNCEQVEVKGVGDPGGPGDPSDPGDPGPGGPANDPLSLAASEFTCPIGPVIGVPAVCTFSLSGANADTSEGELAGTGAVANVVGTATADEDGGWTASGTATCTDDGALRVSFGSESIDAPVSCEGLVAGGGGDGGEPLAVTSGDPVVCTDPVPAIPPLVPGVDGQCLVITITGTGADEMEGSVTATGGVTLGGYEATSLAGGLWTVTGTLPPTTCSADGTLEVTFGSESVSVDVSCGLL